MNQANGQATDSAVGAVLSVLSLFGDSDRPRLREAGASGIVHRGRDRAPANPRDPDG